MDFIRRRILPRLQGCYFLVCGGQDLLSRELVYLSLALIVVSWILTFFRAVAVSYVFYALALAALLFSGFRLFSKNVPARQAENTRYVSARTKFLSVFREARERFRNRKIYRYVACPQCRKRLRLPRGKGEITVTCPACGKRFDART